MKKKEYLHVFEFYVNASVTVVCYVKMFCLCYDILSELFPWTPVKLSILYEHLLLCVRSNLHTQNLTSTILTCKRASRIILAFKCNNCFLFFKKFLASTFSTVIRIKISHNLFLFYRVAINVPFNNFKKCRIDKIFWCIYKSWRFKQKYTEYSK